MKATLIFLALFSGCLSVFGQGAEVKPATVQDAAAPVPESVKKQTATDSAQTPDKKTAQEASPAPAEKSEAPVVAAPAAAAAAGVSDGAPEPAAVPKESFEKALAAALPGGQKSGLENTGGLDLKNMYVGLNRPAAQTASGEEKFHWKPALVQSGIFLAIQHTARMYEGKTRNELDGPFFRDWKESVQNLEGWDDGGKIFTNYVAHPMQGSVTGRIFVNNSERASNREFGKSKNYWESRLKAMLWSAVWSAQFEIGPISEASLGNVGQKRDAFGRSKMTWMDFVLTPTMGTGMLVAEDAIDKYVLKNWIERKTKNSFVRHFFRVVLNPTTAFSNLLRGSAPWRRDNRKW